MASELTTSASFKYSKNGVEMARTIAGTITVTGSSMIHNVQYVGTSPEALALGDISYTGLGWILLKNLDSALDEYGAASTNFITVGRLVSVTYEPFIKLKPGESALLRLDQTSEPFAKNDSSLSYLEYWLIED